MPTLVIHAPDRRVQQERKRSFEETYTSGVGNGYAITQNLLSKLNPGSSVVLLCKDSEKRAEGILVELVPTGKASNGIETYDVRFENIKMVPYKSERLDRNGVAVV